MTLRMSDLHHEGEAVRPKELCDIEGESEDDEEDDERGQTVRMMRKMVDPKLPSAAEVEEHSLTHLPSGTGAKSV